MKIDACLSHKSDEWSTPKKKLYETIMNKGFIDPCPIGGKENCLEKDYNGAKLFINPPFSKLKDFIPWIIEQARKGSFILLLIPVRTDTKYFKELYNSGFIHGIIFISGRLHFNDSQAAPFPSMMIFISNKAEYSIPIACCPFIRVMNEKELIEFIYSKERRI